MLPAFNVEALVPFMFLAYFVGSLVFRLDARLPVVAFMLLLALAAVYLSLGSSAYANTVAVYAYYFLVIGVVLNIVEFARGRPGEAAATPRTLQLGWLLHLFARAQQSIRRVAATGLPPTGGTQSMEPGLSLQERFEELLYQLDERLARGEISEETYRVIRGRWEQRLRKKRESAQCSNPP